MSPFDDKGADQITRGPSQAEGIRIQPVGGELICDRSSMGEQIGS
jgi:hypothetical protein